MESNGFVFGDHRFIDPAETGSLDRLDEQPRQIKGAPPPTYLEGRTREAGPDSPAARDLLLGDFCGHGEPTMTVFDVVIDGEDLLEVGAAMHPDDVPMEQNLYALVVRKPGAEEWFPLFRREWEERQQTLDGITAQPLTAEELGWVSADVARARVAIGFEYPEDADSRDCVTWLTIDLLYEDEEEPACVVNAEMA